MAYPHAARETVPPVWLPVLGLFLPLAVYAADYALRTRRAADLGAACLGQFLAFLTTGIATDLVKLAVGRPRPDFLARCFPHGVPAEVPLEDGFPACEEPGAPGVKDGYKSFPSGHASLAFAGLGFLSLYLVHSFRLRRGAGRPWRRLAATLPWLGALMVGVSRVHDYRHNPSDVLAGAALGTFTAVTVARQTFAPPSSWTYAAPHRPSASSSAAISSFSSVSSLTAFLKPFMLEPKSDPIDFNFPLPKISKTTTKIINNCQILIPPKPIFTPMKL